MRRIHSHALFATTLGLGLLGAASALAQTVITVVNNDGPGEGFNDATPVPPVAGNAGTTLGQQRLNVFQAAADAWEGVVVSAVEIRIDTALDPLTPCTATGGILGRAGTLQAFRNFPGAPLADTWYSGALANSIAGLDNSPANDDIQARFNSSVDNATCLGSTSWFYGIGVPAPAGTISFFDTVKHELAHGLGVQSFVDIVTTGGLFQGRNDAFTNQLHDHSTGLGWPAMTNAERLASATDTGDLHWIGPQVTACAPTVLTAGTAGGHVRMFAPNPVQPGSSVSHFDTALTPDELMEPFATAASDQRLTDRLLSDIGWNVTSPPCIVHNIRLSLLTHDLRISVSGVHTISASRFGRHPLALSVVHYPVGSFAHRPIPSSVHFPPLSPGHFPAISLRHSMVSSRYGEIFDPAGPVINPADPFDPQIDPRFDPQFDPRFDPRFDPQFDPRFDPSGPFGGGGYGMPQGQGFGYEMQPDPYAQGPYAQGPYPQGLGDRGFTPGPHNPVASYGHSQALSFGHEPFRSATHHRVISVAHDFYTSRGHSPQLSWGHHPQISFGHSPVLSWHNPTLSNPHHPILSRPSHNLVPSRVFDGPGFDPAQSQPQPGNEAAPMQDNLEFVPGNRASAGAPPLMPGDPYTAP